MLQEIVLYGNENLTGPIPSAWSEQSKPRFSEQASNTCCLHAALQLHNPQSLLFIAWLSNWDLACKAADICECIQVCILNELGPAAVSEAYLAWPEHVLSYNPKTINLSLEVAPGKISRH